MKKSDAERLIGAFAIALTSTLPPELAGRIADRLDLLAEEIARHEGDTRPGKLCTDLAQTVRQTAQRPSTH